MDDLDDYIRRENLKIFKREIGLEKDAVRRQWLLKRLAEEEAKGSGRDSTADRREDLPRGVPKGDVW